MRRGCRLTIRCGFADFLTPATARLTAFMDSMKVASFHAGDFRDQASRAAEAGGGVAAFPPTYKSDYERLYRFVDTNTEWNRPTYDLWDPSKVEDWLDEIVASGIPYCLLVEHKLERFEPRTVFYGTLKPVYTYANSGKASIRRLPRPAAPFRYTEVELDDLRIDSKVELVAATSQQMNFLKDAFLAKEIQHTTGIANFLVMIDGRLAGGFILTRDKFGHGGIYMLCDFSMRAKSRLSKLIVMLATSSTIIKRLEVRLVQRIAHVRTTAYPKAPVSMNYRGLYDLVKREPGKLHYVSQIRDQTPAEIYQDWFKRFFANARDQGRAGRPEAARKERALHEGATV